MIQVDYQLLIDGAPADEELMAMVREVEVEDHCSLASMVRVRLALGVDETGTGWSPLDDGSFTRLSRLGVVVGVGSHVRETLIDAHVIKVQAVVSEEPGGSSLEVVAMDATVLMSLEEKVRSWPDMTDSDVAEAVFAEHGLATDVEATPTVRAEREETTLQRGTDIELLRMLARRNGYECYVEIDPDSNRATGHFHAPRLSAAAQPALTVNLGRSTNVANLRLEHDLVQPVRVSGHSLDVGRAEAEAVDVDAPQSPALGTSRESPSDRPRRVRVGHTGFSETGELQRFAQAIVDRRSCSIRVEGELSTVVYENVLRAKRPVDLRGLGQRLSGTYYVEKVTHHITGDGYVQRFSLSRNAQGVTGREQFADQERMVS